MNVHDVTVEITQSICEQKNVSLSWIGSYKVSEWLDGPYDDQFNAKAVLILAIAIQKIILTT